MRPPLVMPAVLYARATGGVRRWLDGADRLAGAFLSQALSAREKGELSVRLYDASPVGRGTSLMPWEQAWLERRLPPAPARVLVGACGAGRELLALAEAGRTLDAFDPAPTLVRAAQARLGPRARVLACRYEELSAAVLDGAHNDATPLASGRWDAVLLGWSSLSHVLDETERQRLVRALARLCPRGPWLASFWCDEAAAAPPAPGRVERFGAAWGRRLASARHLPAPPSPRDAFTLHAGFSHRFTRDEIEALARPVGRAVVWDDDRSGHPHATFVPR